MLETERLLIRPFTDFDVPEVFAMRSDPEIMRYIRTPHKDLEETRKWVKMLSSRWEKDGIGFCALIEKETGQFIGWCGLWQLAENDEIEVGYAIAKSHWGRGLASEAAASIVDYGFDELKLDKIVALAREENTPSRRVMEKLGMEFGYIGTFYGRQLVHYEITREDYVRNREAAAS
jgi:ribosomal-protein-alanine N-acetyltransferase